MGWRHLETGRRALQRGEPSIAVELRSMTIRITRVTALSVMVMDLG